MVDRKITGLEVAGSSPVTITFYHPHNMMHHAAPSPPRHTLTIREFKFAPCPRPTRSLQLPPNPAQPGSPPQTHSNPQPLLSRTLENWRRQSSCKSMRVRKREGEAVVFLQQSATEQKPNMFLAWQERCSSSRKFQTVSTRIVQEVVRNIQQQTRSQKRLPQIDQEQSRQKTNELTPLQLITRKLEWEGRVKQPSPERRVRVRPLGAVRGRAGVERGEEGEARAGLTGWEKRREYSEQMQF